MSKRPIFPTTEMGTEPQHFSHYGYGYGYDLQFSYFDFQVLEEARTRRHAKRGGGQDQDRKPPIFKDKEESRSKRSKHKLHQLRHTSSAASSAGKCLRSAGSTLLFWNWNWKRSKKHTYHSRSYSRQPCSASYYPSPYSASGPLYMTDCYSLPETAVTCRAKSGPLTAGPYFNLRELNLASGAQSGSAGAMPVYLVT